MEEKHSGRYTIINLSTRKENLEDVRGLVEVLGELMLDYTDTIPMIASNLDESK